MLIWMVPISLSAADDNNPCVRSNTYRVVILGSSTAAGSGPSRSDSAWVNRYRRFLQSINPQNQVTNLAQGGTTTYQIMPDWYTPPAGRPLTNPNRNVSEAIRLNADAIIVNMPSNDAANNFPVNEQMANFSLIVSSADSAGIPVWVCTTQPRNFVQSSRIQIQMDVRDSVLSLFGDKAIDFWTGFADSTGGLDTTYDSGDGVHMNDLAHRILFQRVRAKNILSHITDTLSKPDHFVSDIHKDYGVCGTVSDSITIYISNRGDTANYSLPIRWRIEDLDKGIITQQYDTLFQAVGTCNMIQRSLVLNTSAGGNWLVSAHLETQGDSVAGNDHSDTLKIERKSPPPVFSSYQYTCAGDSLSLWANGGDTTLWFDLSGRIIGFGDSLVYGPLLKTDTLVVRAVSGPLHFGRRLFTHDASNIDWNGIMFDLVASDTIHLDSLSLRPSQILLSEVTARYRQGSYKGFESDSSAWTLWGIDSVQPTTIGELATAEFGPMTMYPGDTLGVYLSMENGRLLKYQSLSAEAIYTDGPLSLITGTGIANGFSGTYYPRAWSGAVFFHYGFNAEGDCYTDTLVEVGIYEKHLNLGSDTLIGYGAQLVISLPPVYSDVLWSTGDTTRSIAVDSSMLSTGSNQLIIWVQALDTNGCLVADSIKVEFTSLFGSSPVRKMHELKVYPVPARDYLEVDHSFGKPVALEIYNLAGMKLKEFRLAPGVNRLNMDLPAGFYVLSFPEHPSYRRLIEFR